METGRPAEAGRHLLQPMANGPDVDREAAGCSAGRPCSSRQEDRPTPCSSWPTGSAPTSTSPEPSPFVGSRKCAECHPSDYRAEQRASPHARTLYVGSALKDVPLPARPVPDPLAPRIHHRFSRKAADRIEMETRGEDGQVARAVVAYAVGSGEHGITMVTRDEADGHRSRAADLLLHGRPSLAQDQGGRRPAARSVRIHRVGAIGEGASGSACTATRHGSAPPCRSRRSRAVRRRPIAASAASGATAPGSTM